MIHISVIVWALCMLQSVSAFAPEPSSDEITPVAAQFAVRNDEELNKFRGGVTIAQGDILDPFADWFAGIGR